MFKTTKKSLRFVERSIVTKSPSKSELVAPLGKKAPLCGVAPKGQLSKNVVKIKRKYNKLNAADFLEKKLLVVIILLIETIQGKNTYDTLKKKIESTIDEIRKQNFMKRDEHLMIKLIRLTVGMLLRLDTILIIMDIRTSVILANDIAGNVKKLFSKRRVFKKISKQELIKTFNDKFGEHYLIHILVTLIENN